LGVGFANVLLQKKNEQKTSVSYSNGTKANFEYDTIMNRLEKNYLFDSQGDTLFEKIYKYDAIGNITQLNDNLVAINENLIHEYKYDDDNRLINAESQRYDLEMYYSETGRILRKILSGEGLDNNGTFSIDFDNRYFYNIIENPFAVSSLSGSNNTQFCWDRAGNMIFNSEKMSTIFGQMITVCNLISIKTQKQQHITDIPQVVKES
jgi:hypothetical protein